MLLARKQKDAMFTGKLLLDKTGDARCGIIADGFPAER